MALPEARRMDSSDDSEDSVGEFMSRKEERKMLSSMSEEEAWKYYHVKEIKRVELYELKHCNDELFQMLNMLTVFGHELIDDMSIKETFEIARKLKWKRDEIRDNPALYDDNAKRTTREGLEEVMKTVRKCMLTPLQTLSSRHWYL